MCTNDEQHSGQEAVTRAKKRHIRRCFSGLTKEMWRGMERSAAPGWKFCSDTDLSALPAAISPLPWRPHSVFFNNRQLWVPRAFPLAPPLAFVPPPARAHMHLLIHLTTPVRGADVPPALMSSTATARSRAGLCSVMLTKHTHGPHRWVASSGQIRSRQRPEGKESWQGIRLAVCLWLNKTKKTNNLTHYRWNSGELGKVSRGANLTYCLQRDVWRPASDSIATLTDGICRLEEIWGRWCAGEREAWSRPIALSWITGGCLHRGPAQKLTGRASLLVCRSLVFTPHFRRTSSHKHHLFLCRDEPDSGDNVIYSPFNKPSCHYQSVNLLPVGFASILE